MPRPVVQEMLPRPVAEAAVLHEVLAEAWADRRRQWPGTPDRAFVEQVIRDLIDQLRRLRPQSRHWPHETRTQGR